MHGTVFSNRKQYYNQESHAPDSLVRKTSTGHPVEDCQHCPFQVVIELRDNSLWYLCQGHRHSNKADICCMHMFHPKLESNRISNLLVRYATAEQSKNSIGIVNAIFLLQSLQICLLHYLTFIGYPAKLDIVIPKKISC